MKTTTLALATATLIGGLTLGAGSASAACGLGQAGIKAGGAPTSYVMMTKKQMMMKKQMMKRDKMMMRKKMMMKKNMM